MKQVSDTLFSSSGQAFRKALLVQYPREGSWTIAFLTGQPGGDVVNHLRGRIRQRLRADDAEPDVRIFPDDAASADVIELDMSVDEALKYIISMGVVAPNGNGRRGENVSNRPESSAPAGSQSVSAGAALCVRCQSISMRVDANHA